MKRELVIHIAELARLYFDEDALTDFVEEFSRIIEFVEQVEKLPTEGIAPMTSPLDEPSRLRQDEPKEVLSPDDALKNAPENKEGLFAVPKVI